MRNNIQTRNEDFIRRCITIFKSDYAAGAIKPLDSVIERALGSRPHCHYLDYDTASEKLHQIRRLGIDNVVCNPEARAMWTELAAQVDEARQRSPDCSFHKALAFVLNFMRPSRFFITPDTARRILSPHISYSITRNLSERL